MEKYSDYDLCSVYYPATKITFNYMITKNLKDKIENIEGKPMDSIASKVLVHFHENPSGGINCNCGETKMIKCDYSKSERILFSKTNLEIKGTTYTAIIHGFGAHDDAKNNNKMYKFVFCNSKKAESVTLK